MQQYCLNGRDAEQSDRTCEVLGSHIQIRIGFGVHRARREVVELGGSFKYRQVGIPFIPVQALRLK